MESLAEGPGVSEETATEEIADGALIVASSPDAPGELLLAIVLDCEPTAAGTRALRIVPLSTEVAFATDADVILEPTVSPLPYSVMAEIWNDGTLLRDQVEEHRGFIVADVFKRIIALYESAIADADESGLVEASQPVGDGPPVLDDADPRLLFQDEEIERTQRFYVPAAELLLGETANEAATSGRDDELLTVGSLMSHWLDEQGYDANDYAHEIGSDRKHVELICVNRIDPLLGSELLAEILVRPYRDAGIDLHDLDAALTRSFDENADWSLVGASGSGRVFARTSRRRGQARSEAMRHHLGGDPAGLNAEEIEKRKRGFINDVLTALEERAGR